MPRPDPGVPPLRGIVHRDGGAERFSLQRHAPSAALAGIVDCYWDVRWDRRGLPEHGQELLPHPNVQLVVEAGRSGVFGVGTGRSTKVLRGRGRAFGIKLRPGVFTAIADGPAAVLTDARRPLDAVFGAAGAAYEAAILGTDAGSERVATAAAFVAALDPRPGPDALLCRDAVEHIARDRDAVRVEDVARRFDVSMRSLQRLFARHVGKSPKWVIQRYRLHEVVARLEAGAAVDFAALAARLNYCDQAHLSREFSRFVGRSPARYVRDLAGRAEQPPDQ